MAYLKLVLYSILFVLLALFMIRFGFYVNRNVSHDLQLELELADIEMRALNEQIEIVELFNTTLTGVLGGLANPGKSSLTNSISPSLITQISSLCGLSETLKVLTFIGKIVVLVTDGFKGKHGYSLQLLV